MIEFDFTKVDRVVKAIGIATDRAAEASLDHSLQVIYRESQQEVPLNTGLLKSTGKISKWRSAGAVHGEVTYGTGGAESYAIPVHERLDLNHPIGKAKFLEDPVRRNQTAMLDDLATRLQQAWRRL